jgi:hypothetical protein
MFRPTLIPIPDRPNEYEMEFSNSSLELFTTCGRAAARHVIYRRQRDGNSAPLFYGGVIHKALEFRFRGEPEWAKKQQQYIIDAYDTNPAPLDEWRDANCALECMRRYNKEYPFFEEPFTVVPDSVEKHFKIKLGEAEIADFLFIRDDSVEGHLKKVFVAKIHIYWVGYIDCLVQWDGSLLVMDHKTGSRGGQTFYDDFLLNAQPHGYVWAARKLGIHAEGFVVDALIMRPPTGKGQTSEFVRQRFWDTYTDPFLAEWEQDVFDQITDFLEHWARGRFSKGTKWCMGKYGACQYFNNCTLDPTLRELDIWGPAYKDVEHRQDI